MSNNQNNKYSSKIKREKEQYNYKKELPLNEEERDEYLETLKENTKYDIMRMKGLGEMDAEELNETTMDINKRILRKIIVEDIM